MELIVGDNSYITLEDANKIVDENFIGADSKKVFWNSLDDNDKAILICKATKKFNNDRLLFKGRKVDTKQKMQFPRIIREYNKDSLMEIPEMCKIGIVMLALKDAEYDNSDEVKLIRKGVKSFSDGGGMSVSLDSSLLNNVMGIDTEIFYEFFSQYSMIC